MREGPHGPVDRGLPLAISGVFYRGCPTLFVCLKAWAGAFSVGSVAQYVAAITALSENINQLMTTWGELRTNAVILRETFAFFDTPPTPCTRAA